MSERSSESGAQYLLLTRLADEFAARYRAGERPSLQYYIDRHPELADDIRELFPAMVEIEQVKEDQQGATEPVVAAETLALEQVGDFRIIRQVGKGGMGVVYEAEQVSLGRHVALKVLPRSMIVDGQARRRFEREAKSAARLHHTNIVPVFGVGEHDGMPYYVMQFIQGLGLDEVLEELKSLHSDDTKSSAPTGGARPGFRRDISAVKLAHSLLSGEFPLADGKSDEDTALATIERACEPDQRSESARFTDRSDSFALSSSSVMLPLSARADSKLKRRKPTYWQSVAHIGMQVGDALEYAHKQGIRHRDVKPSNLLLDTHGTVWVTDFGLAKADDQQNLTHTGDILGTLRYMPPEAFEGRTDARSDVYSLGLTLYEMLAFRPAFEEKDRRRLIKQVTDEEPPRLGKLNRQLPQDLETIVHKAIDKDAKARYASAGEFSEDLQRFIEDEPIRARKVSRAERLRRWCRRHPAVALLTTTVTLLLVTLAVGATITAGRFGRLAEKEHELRTEAEKRNEELARQDYSHRVALAFHDWQGHQVRPATELLEGCPVERRGWEWAYCQRLCHLDFLTLPVAEGSGWPTDRKLGLTFSPDGRRLAVLGAGGQLTLWDSASGRVVGTQSFPLAFDAVRGNCLAYHPDGRRLVVGCEDGSVRLFDAVSGEVRALAGHAGAVRGVAVGSRGQRVASAGSDGTVRVWDLKCGDAAPLTMASHARGVVSVALSPDEDLLASAGYGSAVELWDAATGGHLATFDGHEKIVYGVTFSPDGRRLASASWDKTIRLWDVAARQHVMTLHGHTSFARAVAFTPDGQRLVSVGEDKAVRLWDAQDGRTLFSLAGHTAATVLVAVHPDGRRVATTSWDGTVKLWDITSNPEVITLRHDDWVGAVALAADGRTLATASGNKFEPSGHRIRLWDAATGRKRLELPDKDKTVDALALSPDGLRLVTGGRDRIANVYDTRTGQQVGKLVGHSDSVRAVVFDPTGKRIATGSLDGSVRVWDAATLSELLAFRQHAGPVQAVVFRPDGESVASASTDQTIKVWQTTTGDVTATLPFSLPALPPLTWGANLLAFRPDGARLVATCGGDAEPLSLVVWDLAARREILILRGHAFPACAVAFSPDGKRIVSGSADQTVKLWDAETGAELFTLRGHGGNVLCLAMSTDGQRIVSGSIDNTANIWDTTPRHEAAHRR